MHPVTIRMRVRVERGELKDYAEDLERRYPGAGTKPCDKDTERLIGAFLIRKRRYEMESWAWAHLPGMFRFRYSFIDDDPFLYLRHLRDGLMVSFRFSFEFEEDAVAFSLRFGN